MDEWRVVVITRGVTNTRGILMRVMSDMNQLRKAERKGRTEKKKQKEVSKCEEKDLWLLVQ